jgi:hypothetical protein
MRNTEILSKINSDKNWPTIWKLRLHCKVFEGFMMARRICFEYLNQAMAQG